MRVIFLALLASLGLCAGSTASAQGIPAGSSQQQVNLGRAALNVYTYRPNCADPKLLIVFHGLGRDASRYRDAARPLADSACMIVATPEFDKERFPTWTYQRGGIVNRGQVMPMNDWTVQYVPALIRWAQNVERRPVDVFMIGHSAGGQFLSRVAAYTATGAKRIVIANPSTHVFPNLSQVPFGMGGLYPRGHEDSQLRRYLATPVTIFLGAEDTGDENRNDSRDAQAQGETRLDRGRNAFAAGQALARQRGWTFNWRLVELSGVGHSGRKMFSSREALEALRP